MKRLKVKYMIYINIMLINKVLNYKTMSDNFIKMIDNIDLSYGFIYECAKLINNLYNYDNYDHLFIKLCSEFVTPIINITKKEHIKEYNEHIRDTISALEHNKEIYLVFTHI